MKKKFKKVFLHEKTCFFKKSIALTPATERFRCAVRMPGMEPGDKAELRQGQKKPAALVCAAAVSRI